MSKITIAKYKDGYITIKEYNKSIHRNGEIFCPFCDPTLEVTGVISGFFKALPNRGGHNCGKNTHNYLNADWKGRHLIELISNEGEIEVKIDINSLENDSFGLSKNTGKLNNKENFCRIQEVEYNRYKDYKDVLRDVIRSVNHMKSFIQKNPIDSLNKINFSYSFGNEILGINDIVKLVFELDTSLHQKKRFVIYKIESIRIKNKKIYINSYETEGKTVTVSFQYPSNKNQTGLKKNDYVIAFGKLSYYKPSNQYYLNINSDLNIVKMKKKDIAYLFDEKEMVKKVIPKPEKESVVQERTEHKRVNQENSIPNVYSTNGIEQDAHIVKNSTTIRSDELIINYDSKVVNENIIGHDKLQDSTLSEKSNKDAKGKKKGLFSRLFKWLK